jgi:hypothetical protein
MTVTPLWGPALPVLAGPLVVSAALGDGAGDDAAAGAAHADAECPPA